MKMRTIVGLSGIVALAALSTTANAIMMVNAVGDDPKGMGMRSVTYAMETLMKDAVTEEDDVTYYQIARDHFVSGPAEVEAAAGVDYYVSYVLNGMVFHGTSDDLTLTAARADSNDDEEDEPAGTLERHAGGAAGDNSVVFKLTATGTIHPKNLLRLTAKFAVSEGGIGGITRTVTNATLQAANVPGIKAVGTHSLPAAVKAAPALDEVIEANEQIMSARAKHEFLSFSDGDDPSDTLAQSVGTIHLTVVGGSTYAKNYRNARSAGIADGTDLADISSDARVNALLDITVVDGADLDNSVTFSGDFSFAKTAGYGTAACGSLTEIRKPSDEDADVLTDEIVPQGAEKFGAEGVQSLCIVVDGKTPIPNTDHYMVTTKYKGLAMAAFPPVGGTHSLARISRDGYSRNIPYMTTDDGYNQRVVIVNRWRETEYAIGSFEMEDGVEVTAGDDAAGTLPEGTTVLRMTNIVTIEGGTRASGTVSVVAPESTIDVAVQQVNLMNRSVDTVYLD